MLIGNHRTVTVAFCDGEMATFELTATRPDRDRFCSLLDGLRLLGKVAAWRVGLPVEPTPIYGVIDVIAGRFGRLVVGAVLAAPEMRTEPQPEWLMPISPFDNVPGRAPTATARLFGLNMEVIAIPSADEEHGIRLPARDGLWLMHTMPASSGG